MAEKNRKSGIDIIGDVPWGTHFCQFYKTKKDLLDILVPYFKEGLENNEFCMWITSDPLVKKEAEKALRKALPHFDQYREREQIEIIPHTDWYLKEGEFNLRRVFDAWIDKLNQALDNGYDGMRVTGNTAWLEKKDWKSFTEYEEELNNVICEYCIIAICSYSLDRCSASDIIDVVSNHGFALIRKEGVWKIIKSSEHERLEDAVRSVTEQYRSFVQNFHGIAFYRHIDFTTIFMHGALEEITGYTEEMFISGNLRWDRIIHPEDLTILSESFKKMRSVPKYSDMYEYRIIRKDGQLRWILEYCQNLCDDSGKPILIRGARYDITERKTADEVLKKSESLLRATGKMARVGGWEFDVETLKQVWTQEIYEIHEVDLDYEPTVPKGIDFYAPEHRPIIAQAVQRAIDLGEPFDLELMIITAKGNRLWVRAIGQAHQSNGKTTKVFGTFQDITKHKMVAEELRKKDEFNFALFQHNPIETIVTDLEGKIVKCNIAKKKSGDRIPNIGDVMYRDYAGKQEIDMYTEMLECIRTGKLKKFPERKYGDRFLFIKIAPFPHGAIITSQDITERKDLEESLKVSELELKKQKIALEQKTIALREIVGEIEEEKNKIKDDITANIREVLLPILEKLELKETSNKYIDLLRHHLEKIVYSFGKRMKTNSVNLTPREIEICTMVESGLTNKEISKLLSISCHTVETHRNSIREKFNITNKNINLSSFLQQL